MRSTNRWTKIARGIRAASTLLLAAASVAWASSGKEVSVFKMGGSIDVDQAPEGAKLTTMGGNILLQSVAGRAALKTFGGNIEVKSAAGSVTATTMAGNVVVHMNDDSGKLTDQSIELSSNSGDVSLYLPSDFGATLELTLAYTENQKEPGRIIENLGLKQTTSSDWDRWHGTPRKYVYATGTVGDGKNHIVINNISGNITVRRGAGT